MSGWAGGVARPRGVQHAGHPSHWLAKAGHWGYWEDNGHSQDTRGLGWGKSRGVPRRASAGEQGAGPPAELDSPSRGSRQRGIGTGPGICHMPGRGPETDGPGVNTAPPLLRPLTPAAPTRSESEQRSPDPPHRLLHTQARQAQQGAPKAAVHTRAHARSRSHTYVQTRPCVCLKPAQAKDISDHPQSLYSPRRPPSPRKQPRRLPSTAHLWPRGSRLAVS